MRWGSVWRASGVKSLPAQQLFVELRGYVGSDRKGPSSITISTTSKRRKWMWECR